MQPLPPVILELAQRLRSLREGRWPDVRLTQAALAKALGDEEPLSAATVSSWESLTAPKLPPRNRMLAYARFFATRRSVAQPSPRLLPIEDLTAEEEGVYEALEAELLRLRDAAKKPSGDEIVAIRRSWHFPAGTGPATIVCAQLPKGETSPLADLAHPNYNELLSFADLDALVELHGHIRAENPMIDVFYKAAPNVVPDDLSGHVILVGGVAWNDITKRLSEMISLPVRQVGYPSLKTGDIFVAQLNGKEHKFLPKWNSDRQVLTEDVGLLARVPNPLNSSRTLTICNGIHSPGVAGAVRCLTDARLREFNESYLTNNFSGVNSFVILMRIQVIEGQAMTPDLNISSNILYQWPENANN
jgi:hypothetical protein